MGLIELKVEYLIIEKEVYHKIVYFHKLLENC